jgi:hypothetical protein
MSSTSGPIQTLAVTAAQEGKSVLHDSSLLSKSRSLCTGTGFPQSRRIVRSSTANNHLFSHTSAFSAADARMNILLQ